MPEEFTNLIPKELQTIELGLRERQWVFSYAQAMLRAYAATIPNIRLREGESYVGDSINKPSEDTPHLRTGMHFFRLAVDLMMDAQNAEGKWRWEPTGTHPVWKKLGVFWKSLHPLCRWGGDFSGRKFDPNHFSITYMGVQ